MFLKRPFAAAPGYKRVFTTATGKISLAINWEDVTCNGVVHIPDLHETLSK